MWNEKPVIRVGSLVGSFFIMALPGLAWVIIVFDCSKVPLLCKEGLGEVEA